MVAVLEGRPYVTANGVELWHRACWEVRDQPIVEEQPAPSMMPPPMPRRRRPIVAASAIATMFGVAAAGWAWAGVPSASLANVDVPSYEPISVHGAFAAKEVAPPEPDLLERFPMPDADGVPLDEKYPSLASWIHPVSASTELMPLYNRSRQFGSTRHGIDRPECGGGHCGVDLDGPRGRPIVAVAGGIVIRVERRELGADGRSGRYVRIQHPDGPLTAYMHLDEVAEELRVGARVAAGDYLGTLGASAIFASAAHLHFTLEVPKRFWERGDHLETRYLDPAPHLVRAKVVPVGEARLKPAS